MKPTLLILIHMRDAHRASLAEHFDLLYVPDAADRPAALAEHGAKVRAVLTNGSVGVATGDLDRMPAVELVSALGVGHENVPVDYAKKRGVAVSNGAGTNAGSVADHAFALLLAVVRAVPEFDAACRAGVWRDALPMRPMVSGRRLGLIGFGNIGQKVAQRGAGFELEIGYHTRKPYAGMQATHFDTPLALAAWSDYLVIATPGGQETRHMVDRAVLDALGPRGFLVNVARGSVVDTAALADALRVGTLGGAALDVYESEPEPPHELLGLPNLVLSPHVAGASPEAIDATVRHFIANAQRHFAGESLLTPV